MHFFHNLLDFGPLMTITFGVLVLLIGKLIKDKVQWIKRFSIPDAVVGGVLFSLLALIIYLIADIKTQFDMRARDILLIYFFTTIGINVHLKDIVKGGRELIVLMGITFAIIVIQNGVGVGLAKLMGGTGVGGLLAGSVSLIGGHGTAIAWAPELEKDFGVTGLSEIGVTCATLGLIFASLLGGPVAKHLINKFQLKSSDGDEMDVGVDENKEESTSIVAHDFLNAVLAINICVVLGYVLDSFLKQHGVKLPLFVSCLVCGLIASNIIPFKGFKKNVWPSRKPALALIADVCLGTFLSMSLMSMKLWTLASLALPILTILLVQVIVVVLVIRFILFPLLHKSYDAAVICAGFGGFSIGSTPIAIASMTSVTNKYGPSHIAFLVVPMLCAFFIDLSNNLIITLFTNLL